jgi:reactive intermediate/imine deaminase
MRHRPLYALSVVLLAAAPLFAGDRPHLEHLSSGKVMPPGLPFSEAVRVGDVVFLSGQIGIRPGTRELAPGGIAAEAKQTMENIRATLSGIGLGMGDLVKCTVMLDDMAEWGAFNEVYATFFDGRYPARSAFGADGLAMGAKVEVECLAAARPPAPGAE